MSPLRLVLLTGPPVPFKINLYRALAQSPDVDFCVVFASSGGATRPYDDGFGTGVTWDGDLLSGYRSLFLRRAAQSPILGDSFWSVRDPDVIRKILHLRPDVLWVDGYNSATYLMGICAQRLRRRPTILREEQTLLHPRPLLTTVVKQIALRALLAGQHVMYVSTENRRWLEHHGVSAERLHATPYSVDNAFFRAEAERLTPQRDRLRAEFGMAHSDSPVIFTACRFVDKKQPMFLLEAFRQLRQTMDCRLLIAGGGPLEANMRREIVARAIPDVHFAGFLNQREVSRGYAAADVFALLSKEHETFGMVVPEAMNFGLPVVVSDKVGCAADLVAPGVNGAICSSTDVRSAVDALRWVLSDDNTVRRLGEASLAKVQDWNQERAAAGILEATSQAVAHGERGGGAGRRR